MAVERKRGRPRRPLNVEQVRRLRDEGKTLNEIAAAVECGRGTVARALAHQPSKVQVGRHVPLSERAGEMARNRKHTAEHPKSRLLIREHARHLVHQRWGDGMEVEGRPFKADKPNGSGRGWLGAVLIAGGLVLWAMGCPVPL